MNWDAMTAISTAIATATVVGALVYAGIQIHEAQKTRKMQAFASILEQLGQEKEREARRYVILKFPEGETDLGKLSDEDRIKVESVLACFDRVGFFVSKKFIPEAYVADLIGVSIVRCWKKLSSYVRERRDDDTKVTGMKSDYVRHFEALEEMVRKHV
jgi:hypothetical protein